MSCRDPHQQKKNLKHERSNRKLCVEEIPEKSSGIIIKKISAEKLVLDAEQINGVKQLLDWV